MLSRRKFIFDMLATNAILLAAPKIALAQQSISTNKLLNTSSLCIPIYGPDRLPHNKEYKSILAKININTEKIEYLPSTVHNLHGIVESNHNNSNSLKLGIGHESEEYMEVYDHEFNHIETKQFPYLTFRGHGINHKDGVLITAEPTRQYKKDGILLYLDTYGNEIGRTTTGGKRPHEIVDCGNYYAIAHYGDEPINHSAERQPTLIDNCELQPSIKLNPEATGVSFINKNDLTVHSFFPLPGNGRTTHLAVTEDGNVLAMGMNAYFGDKEDLERCSVQNNVNLLNIELKYNLYETYVPIYKIDPDKGIVETIQAPANIMRRGQSFSFDHLTHLIVGTFAASQTLFIRSQNNPDKFINTLKFGIADPRGCALIPGTGLVAVSGNSDNIAIIDVAQEKLVKIIGVPLGNHSHLYWWA